jgi:hypothetical protein
MFITILPSLSLANNACNAWTVSSILYYVSMTDYVLSFVTLIFVTLLNDLGDEETIFLNCYDPYEI